MDHLCASPAAVGSPIDVRLNLHMRFYDETQA